MLTHTRAAQRMHAPRTTRALTCALTRALTRAFLAGRQVDVGARRQVGPTDCGELLVRYVQPGMLLPQIRKLKLAPALLKVVTTAVQYKRNALEGQKDKTLGGVPTMGDEISIELFKAMQVRPPPQALPHLPQPPPHRAASASPQRLRNELDPLHVSASHCTDADVVLGSLGARRHAQTPPALAQPLTPNLDPNPGPNPRQAHP